VSVALVFPMKLNKKDGFAAFEADGIVFPWNNILL
jgi:hypothetical protein